MADKSSNSLTQALAAIRAGQLEARESLLRALYDELHGIARAQMAKVPPGQTLQPTALANEAYLRLFGKGELNFKDRREFFFAAARSMHDILVEQARRKAALKRGGGWKRSDVGEVVLAIDTPAADMLALEEALGRLEADDPRKHELVQLRFFAGLTAEEAADVMGVSLRTVEREWRYIRGRLHRELSEDEIS